MNQSPAFAIGVCLLLAVVLQAGSVRAAAGLGVAQSFSIESIRDAERAQQALTATAAARTGFRQDWERKRYECHQRLAVNRCLAQVNTEQRDVEGRLTAIEIHARQVIRHSRLVDRNTAEARQQPVEKSPEAPPLPRAERIPPSTVPKASEEANAQQRAQRISEQQQRETRHQSRLEDSQATARRELERRRARQAELERKQREHAQKLEQGKRNAELFEQRQKRAEDRQKEIEQKRSANKPAASAVP